MILRKLIFAQMLMYASFLAASSGAAAVVSSGAAAETVPVASRENGVFAVGMFSFDNAKKSGHVWVPFLLDPQGIEPVEQWNLKFGIDGKLSSESLAKFNGCRVESPDNVWICPFGKGPALFKSPHNVEVWFAAGKLFTINSVRWVNDEGFGFMVPEAIGSPNPPSTPTATEMASTKNVLVFGSKTEKLVVADLISKSVDGELRKQWVKAMSRYDTYRNNGFITHDVRKALAEYMSTGQPMKYRISKFVNANTRPRYEISTNVGEMNASIEDPNWHCTTASFSAWLVEQSDGQLSVHNANYYCSTESEGGVSRTLTKHLVIDGREFFITQEQISDQFTYYLYDEWKNDKLIRRGAFGKIPFSELPTGAVH